MDSTNCLRTSIGFELIHSLNILLVLSTMTQIILPYHSGYFLTICSLRIGCSQAHWNLMRSARKRQAPPPLESHIYVISMWIRMVDSPFTRISGPSTGVGSLTRPRRGHYTFRELVYYRIEKFSTEQQALCFGFNFWNTVVAILFESLILDCCCSVMSLA